MSTTTIDKKLSRTYFDFEKERPMHKVRTFTWRYDPINDHRLGKIPLSTKILQQEVLLRIIVGHLLSKATAMEVAFVMSLQLPGKRA